MVYPKRLISKIALSVAVLGSVAMSSSSAFAQTFPDMLYYKFNESGGTTTLNEASPFVGSQNATVNGHTLTPGAGQFNGGLVGIGGTSNTNFVDTGWQTNLSGDWTMHFWVDYTNGPPTTLIYILGDVTASSLRCFTNGVAGAGNWMLRGGGMTDVLVTGGAPVAGPAQAVTFVYDSSVPEIRAYLNGVLNNTVAQPVLNIQGTGVSNFAVGAQGGGTNSCLSAGQAMDEFRLYGSALTALEVSQVWNATLDDTPANDDVAITSLFVPNGGVNSTVTADITVVNKGLNVADGTVDLDIDNDGFADGSDTFAGLAAGDTVVVQIQGTVPGALGTYTASATATMTSATDEKPFNNTTATNYDVVAGDDVEATSITNVSAFAGAQSTFDVVVTNNGFLSADGNVDVDVDNDGITDATGTFTGLVGGASTTVNIVATSPATVGNFTATGTAILTSGVDQDNTNDVATTNYTTVPTSDVEVTSITATPNPIPSGTAISFDVVVTNNGNSSADMSVDIDFENDGIVDASSNVSGLASGASQTETFNGTAPGTAGNVTVSATVTMTSGIDQDITNDTATSIYAVTPSCVTAFPYLETFDTWPTGNGAFDVTTGWIQNTNDNQNWTVFAGNTGSSPTGPTQDYTNEQTGVAGNYLYTETSGPAVGNVFAITSICFDMAALTAPKLSFFYHAFHNNQTAGEFHVDIENMTTGVTDSSVWSLIGQFQTAEADPWENEVLSLLPYAGSTIRIQFRTIVGGATNFYNDTGLDQVSIFDAADDISVTAFSVNGAASAGNPIAFDVEVTNTGSNVADGNVDLDIDNDGIVDVSDTFTALASGNTVNFTLNSIAPATAATYTAVITANLTSGTDGNPADNTSNLPYAVAPNEDLAITAFTGPGTIGSGSAMSLDITVKNQGGSPADGNVEVDFDTDGIVDDTQGFTGLASGDSTTLTFNTNAPTTGGNNISTAVVNMTSGIDGDLSNNTSTFTTYVVPASGGPDVYGYIWESSLDGTVPFNYVDISGDPNTVNQNLTDDSFASVTIPFNFNYYGTNETVINICSNGWMNFGAGNGNTSLGFNGVWPNAAVPNGVVSPFWDDLNPSSGGQVLYLDDSATNNRVIIQWNGVVAFGGTVPMSFQIHLYTDGTIEFHYLDMDENDVVSATVGWENQAGDDGIAITDNAPFVSDNLAVRIGLQILPDNVAVSNVVLNGVAPASNPISFDVTVANFGTNVADGDVNIDIDSDGIDDGTAAFVGLASGASTTVTINTTAPATAGPFTATATAVMTSGIDGNLNNNTGTVGYTVTPNEDAGITSLTANPNPVPSSSLMDFNVAVQNFGGSVIDAQVDIDFDNDGIVDASSNISGLASGATQTETFSTTSPGTAGSYIASATVILTSGIDGDPSNDTASLTFSVTPSCETIYPYTETFDTWATGNGAFDITTGWTQDTNDNQNWTVFGGSTGSVTTGPTQDYTAEQGLGSGLYLYTETSGPAVGNVFSITSHCFDLLSLTDPQLSFFYHAFHNGQTAGEFHVDIIDLTTGITDSSVWSLIGQFQTAEAQPWEEALVSLSAHAGNTVRFRFRTIVGGATNFYNDTALDQVSVREAPAIANDEVELTSIDVGYSVAGNCIDCYDVVLTVTNNGGNTVSFDVNATIGTNYNQTVNVPNLASLASAQVTFPSFDPSAEAIGNVTMTAATQLAGDIDPSNDVATYDIAIDTEAFGYDDGLNPTNDGLGFNTATGSFVNRFDFCNAVTIDKIIIWVRTPGDMSEQFSVSAWNADGPNNEPGTLLQTLVPPTTYTALAAISPLDTWITFDLSANPLQFPAGSTVYFGGDQLTASTVGTFPIGVDQDSRTLTGGLANIFYYAPLGGGVGNWTNTATVGANFIQMLRVGGCGAITPDDVVVSIDGATLSWPASNNANNYWVYTSANPNGPWSPAISAGNVLTWTDPAGTATTEPFYYVTADSDVPVSPITSSKNSNPTITVVNQNVSKTTITKQKANNSSFQLMLSNQVEEEIENVQKQTQKVNATKH
ncbi:MAG: hypothetical protein DWQ06_15620 [Calditrichaeota bacterium]|nr:MAG: hypothetical protein DWQ06_15620 [Calditrichota bacterium]